MAARPPLTHAAPRPTAPWGAAAAGGTVTVVGYFNGGGNGLNFVFDTSDFNGTRDLTGLGAPGGGNGGPSNAGGSKAGGGSGAPASKAGGGSGAWYAMELTELLPHVARGLNINWDEATRYAGLNAES